MNKIRRSARKILLAPTFWVVVFILLLTVASNHPLLQGSSGWSANAEDRPSLKAMNDEKSLLREGTVITDSRGRFRLSEERIIFTDESLGKSLMCLENSMLQRIYSFSKDDDGGRQRWTVSGKITEFNGENFLWLDRATRIQ
jgi:hypothetical protein